MKIDITAFKSVKLRIFDHSSLPAGLFKLVKFWHVIYFSASVLLGIRFKKEWTRVSYHQNLGQKGFLTLVTIEYFLGIGLFVMFALLVQGARFGFIRDLLGF